MPYTTKRVGGSKSDLPDSSHSTGRTIPEWNLFAVGTHGSQGFIRWMMDAVGGKVVWGLEGIEKPRKRSGKPRSHNYQNFCCHPRLRKTRHKYHFHWCCLRAYTGFPRLGTQTLGRMERVKILELQFIKMWKCFPQIQQTKSSRGLLNSFQAPGQQTSQTSDNHHGDNNRHTARGRLKKTTRSD